SLALALVLYIFVVNWDYVGGARGAYVLQPRDVPFGLPRYIHLIYAVQLVMAAFALVVARAIEHSTLGRGLAAIRDDELAAECSGVPTLKLKIFSTMVSCALMGMAGTTFPYYLSYIEPSSAFSLSYAVNSIAMPLIGGLTALDGVDFLVRPGERVGLIGPNGSGKSTLVNCIAGTLRNEEGSIRFEGRDIRGHAAHKRIRLGLARSFQIPKPFASMTVLDNLCVPLLYAARRHERLAPGRIVEEALRILEQVGLAGRARARSGGLTQVDLRKLELARP